MNRIKLLALTVAAAAGSIQAANAAIIPYPNSGTENSATYNFTAANSGPIVGYFAGTAAAYDEVVGMSVNGGAVGSYGLDNHASSLGQQFNFGNVTAGDQITFVLHVFDTAGYVYSNPSLNGPYDGVAGHQHVYSVNYNAGSNLLDPSIPSGVYVAFEDLQLNNPPDWNYFDDTFVFTNVNPVPEPTTMVAGAMLLLPFGLSAVRVMRNRKA